jgi:antitoxin component YwqK of YwqJK toxin-antitoxin module
MYRGAFKDNKPVGEWLRYHEEGGLKALLQYSETSDTVKARLYETASQPVAEGVYVREKKEGIWLYYSGETKISEESFMNGIKSGICRKFYPTGELLEESLWKENRKEGKYQAFFPTGKPFLQCIFSEGIRNGRCFTYYPSGLTEVESQYKNDKPDGEWKYLDENGNIRFTLLYEKGILKNPEALDSLGTKELEELEKQKGKLDDPEKYLQNPEEYLMRKR